MARRFALDGCDYAHRGLWQGSNPPENSLAAFEAAVQHGYGIELDVRLSADNFPVVFHDPVLDRMTDASGLVQLTALYDLKQTRLQNTEETIPSFEDLLDLINGRVPLLVELKTDGRDDDILERVVLDQLVRYEGPAAVMSFDARAMDVVTSANSIPLCGQLIEPIRMTGKEAFKKKCRALEAARVDYASVWHEDVEATRESLGPDFPLITWTVKSEDICRRVRPLVDGIIFERLTPPLMQPLSGGTPAK